MSWKITPKGVVQKLGSTSTNDGRKLHIAFTLRKNGVLIRVISARDMHRKERTTYEKA
jgi:uncharacterized DUF497 family protein